MALSGQAAAGALRERWLARQTEQMTGKDDENGVSDDEMSAAGRAISCAEWAQRANRLQARLSERHPGPRPDRADVAYGDQPLQTLDVFLPKAATDRGPAPIIAMVHGGGWCIGDKANLGVTQNKVARWMPKGFLFVSVNYPMISQGSDALAQAKHIARAAAFIQQNAKAWGGDPKRLILMGHSAGAHLVSLVNADAKLRALTGPYPLLGVISLDAGAIDVVQQMPKVSPVMKPRYREAFGAYEAGWIAASPFHQLDSGAAPWLGVCSTRRQDDPCGQARAYAKKSQSLGIRAVVLPEAKSHGEINKEVGLPGDYTKAIEAFMASLDSRVAEALE
jgi:acetyl esterase/lipase